MTGVVKRVSTWLINNPPMMLMPSGFLSSDPTPLPKASGHRTQQRRHGGHHDGTEPQQAGLINRFFWRLAFLTLGFQGEIDHHDGVLLHNADQQNDADERDDVEILVEEHQRRDSPHAGRGQSGKNREGVNVAFVQHAENDVHRNDGGQNQQRFIGQRRLERLRRALESRLDACRHIRLPWWLGGCDRPPRRAMRRARD